MREGGRERLTDGATCRLPRWLDVLPRHRQPLCTAARPKSPCWHHAPPGITPLLASRPGSGRADRLQLEPSPLAAAPPWPRHPPWARHPALAAASALGVAPPGCRAEPRGQGRPCPAAQPCAFRGAANLPTPPPATLQATPSVARAYRRTKPSPARRDRPASAARTSARRCALLRRQAAHRPRANPATLT